MTLNGTVAYLHYVCLLTHTTVHPTAPKLVESETTKVDPVKTSSKSDYLEALPGLNLCRSQLLNNNKTITGVALHLNSYPQEVTKHTWQGYHRKIYSGLNISQNTQL